MGTLWQDIRFGLRVLYKSPGFTAVAILTLALGIGANTAIFSFIDAWLIKPLPYPQADRLMVLLSHDTKKGLTGWGVTSTADFVDYQQQSTSFDQLVPWTAWAFNLTSDGPPERIVGGRVGWNFFQTLDAKPILGRAFLPQESQPGNDHEVILGEGLWKSRFASDPHIIGRQMKVDGESYTIVGVVPGKFQFPLLGLSNLWTPIALTPEERADRSGAWFQAFGRLKPGVTQTQAGDEIASIAARLAKLYAGTNTNQTTVLSPMTYEIGKNEGAQQVTICMYIVGLVLLIACANVANLMLARATRRTKEFALRATLGATRPRLVRQLLTESMLLFFFGGAGGVLFGMWGMQWIESAIPGRVRGYLVNYGQVNMDWTVLGFTLGIALLCGLIFGLAPAFQSSRLDLNREIKESSGQASSSSHGARLRHIFVAGEIALAVVVLISTTLLVESFVRMVGSDPGFRVQGVVTAEIELPKTGYPSDAQIRNFEEALHARLLAIPGAQSAAISQFIPFGQSGDSTSIHVVGKPPEPAGESVDAMDTAVSPEFFSTMQIPLLRGRVFTPQDDSQSPLAVVINQTLVEQQFGTKDPIGQKLEVGDKHTTFEIVGVVGNVKFFFLGRTPAPGDLLRLCAAAGTQHRHLSSFGESSFSRRRNPRRGLVGGRQPAAFRGAHAGRPDSRAKFREFDHDSSRRLFRRAGLAVGRDRHLRFDGAFRDAAHARDRHSHGARCESAADHADDHWPGIDGFAGRNRRRTYCGRRRDACACIHALRGGCRRSLDVRCRCNGLRADRVARVLHSRAARHVRGSDGRIAL